MKLARWIIALTLVVACTPRPAPPTVVSQSEMNPAVLQRIKDDGTTRCTNDGWLKAVEWAYETTPVGGLSDLPPRVSEFSYRKALPKTLRSSDRERALVHDAMQSLADQAPRAYRYDSTTERGTKAATYICEDGAQYRSETYKFVP